jgi:predicted GIY-YIG superfamily endonuclease
MYYVYLVRSLVNQEITYIGFTTYLKQRLETHNSGGSAFTKDFRPWKLVTFIGFHDKAQALAFEKYLKE